MEAEGPGCGERALDGGLAHELEGIGKLVL